MNAKYNMNEDHANANVAKINKQPKKGHQNTMNAQNANQNTTNAKLGMNQAPRPDNM